MSDIGRIRCLLKILCQIRSAKLHRMDHDYLTDRQHDLIISLEEQFEKRGNLSGPQLETLESIYKQAIERDRPFRR